MGFVSARRLALIVMAVAGLLVACSSSNSGSPSAASTTPSTSAAPSTSPAPSTATTPGTSAATSTASAPSTSAAPSTPSAATTAPEVAAFAGRWTGHDRSVTISTTGLGQEFVSDGCCTTVLSTSFKITNLSTSGATQVATVTVLSFTAGSEFTGTKPKPGDTGTLTLSGGVLTDSFSKNTFCDPVQTAKGTCGA